MTEEEWSDFDRRRMDFYYEESPPPYGALTEEEWLTSGDPQRMLELLAGKNRDRKLRLFACACCRGVWGLLGDEPDRRAVAVAERFADGEATLEELVAAHEGCGSAHTPGGYASDDLRFNDMLFAACGCVGEAHRKARKKATCRQGAQASLLRDVFGNPFRPVTFDPACRNPTALSLAQATYAERTLPSGELDPVRLCVLADALEEAGCINEDILTHLRSTGPHVRGCWALDLILGKE